MNYLVQKTMPVVAEYSIMGVDEPILPPIKNSEPKDYGY